MLFVQAFPAWCVGFDKFLLAAPFAGSQKCYLLGLSFSPPIFSVSFPTSNLALKLSLCKAGRLQKLV